MKVSLILLTSLFFTANAQAQQKNIFKNKPWEDFKRKELLTQKLKQMNSPIAGDKSFRLPLMEQNHKWFLKLPLAGTYKANNGKGSDVFAMQPGNMPCIVPDKTFTSNMPIAKTGLNVEGFVSPFKESAEETEKKK